MSLLLPDNFPAALLLEKEHIFVTDNRRQMCQSGDFPLRLLVLNLMPLKIPAETDLLRLLANAPFQIEVSFLRIRNHVPKNTPVEHLDRYYVDFDSVCHTFYDGMIVTGAPVELLDFDQVNYWSELCSIFDWSRKQVGSVFYICWAAQAGLFHHYGIPKYALGKKKFGVFRHRVLQPECPIFRGFDDWFMVPHSRHTEIRENDIRKVKELALLSTSPDAGVYMVMARGGREFFVTGHSEYSPLTLDTEYRRDVAKGLDIDLPENYYAGNDPDNLPEVRWRGHANLLFLNWLNYYVYQKIWSEEKSDGKEA